MLSLLHSWVIYSSPPYLHRFMEVYYETHPGTLLESPRIASNFFPGKVCNPWQFLAYFDSCWWSPFITHKQHSKTFVSCFLTPLLLTLMCIHPLCTYYKICISLLLVISIKLSCTLLSWWVYSQNPMDLNKTCWVLFLF